MRFFTYGSLVFIDTIRLLDSKWNALRLHELAYFDIEFFAYV